MKLLLIPIFLLILIGCEDCKDPSYNEMTEYDEKLNSIQQQNQEILNMLTHAPNIETHQTIYNKVDSVNTNVINHHNEITDHFYKQDSVGGVVPENQAVATDDLSVVEFTYKGNKYARFSLSGPGRGFAIPLGCNTNSTSESESDPDFNNKSNSKYNIIFK